MTKEEDVDANSQGNNKNNSTFSTKNRSQNIELSVQGGTKSKEQMKVQFQVQSAEDLYRDYQDKEISSADVLKVDSRPL